MGRQSRTRNLRLIGRVESAKQMKNKDNAIVD